jgi:hypothetical protein
MGAGASTASRLRKALVIRAFNLRSPNESLEDQFQPYTQIINGKRCISAPEIKKALDFDAPWVDDLFKIFFGEKVNSAHAYFVVSLPCTSPYNLQSAQIYHNVTRLLTSRSQ